jgi:SOS-response transcriptional repressor LexA
MAELKGKFPNGLASAMKKKEMGVTELARLVDTSKQNVQRWRDQERKLTPEWAEKLAPHLEVTREILIFQKPAKGPRSAPKTAPAKFTQVPLLDSVTAGKLRSPSSQIPVEDVPLLAFFDLGRGDFFALKVEGDSVDRVSPEGSTIVVNRADRTLVSGKFYVFSLRGETTYKMWQGGENAHLAPYSTNPSNKPIFFKKKSDLEVIGRVKRTVLDL